MSKKTFKAEFGLGDKVRDTITSFTGTITGIAFYLNGCIQCAVVPSVDKDGKIIDTEWFDQQQLEIVTPESKRATPKIGPNGGPQRDAPRG
jgi:hypothetical protein